MRWVQSVLPLPGGKECEHCGRMTLEYSELVETIGPLERVVAKGCPDCLEQMK